MTKRNETNKTNKAIYWGSMLPKNEANLKIKTLYSFCSVKYGNALTTAVVRRFLKPFYQVFSPPLVLLNDRPVSCLFVKNISLFLSQLDGGHKTLSMCKSDFFIINIKKQKGWYVWGKKRHLQSFWPDSVRVMTVNNDK